tara:strand:+ start:422 stop:604 length:183 start_codon:yes stop_codon:yes gene_type:complete
MIAIYRKNPHNRGLKQWAMAIALALVNRLIQAMIGQFMGYILVVEGQTPSGIEELFLTLI